jgi:hypothetical protein
MTHHKAMSSFLDAVEDIDNLLLVLFLNSESSDSGLISDFD